MSCIRIPIDHIREQKIYKSSISNTHRYIIATYLDDHRKIVIEYVSDVRFHRFHSKFLEKIVTECTIPKKNVRCVPLMMFNVRNG